MTKTPDIARIIVEGLPSGYEGDCTILSEGVTGEHPQFGAPLDGRSVEVPHTEGTLFVYIWTLDEADEVVAVFVFGATENEIKCDTAEVLDAHQRKGIATAVYDFVAKLCDLEVVPSGLISEKGQLLWQGLRSKAGY